MDNIIQRTLCMSRTSVCETKMMLRASTRNPGRKRFFFSSRRRHTRSKRDWSSDVCSSDLAKLGKNNDPEKVFTVTDGMIRVSGKIFGAFITEKEYDNYHLVVEFKWGNETYPPREKATRDRSEERRVGKECRCRWYAEP